MDENRKEAGLGHREAEIRRLKGQTERREEEKESGEDRKLIHTLYAIQDPYADQRFPSQTKSQPW